METIKYREGRQIRKQVLTILSFMAAFLVQITGNIYVFVGCLVLLLVVFIRQLVNQFIIFKKLRETSIQFEKSSAEAASIRKIRGITTAITLLYVVFIVLTLVLRYPFWSSYF